MNITAKQLDDEVAVTYGTEAFLSADYAQEEKQKLWPRVWQMAGREEDIPNVGDYFTYDICDDSIIIIRTAPEMPTLADRCATKPAFESLSARM